MCNEFSLPALSIAFIATIALSANAVEADRTVNGVQFAGPPELGSLYSLVSEEKSWFDAEAACNTFGGHLASPSNWEEFDFVKSLAQKASAATWVGLFHHGHCQPSFPHYDMNLASGKAWPTDLFSGTNASHHRIFYVNQASGMDDPNSNGSEFCIVFDPNHQPASQGGPGIDSTCSSKNAYICEIASPTPAYDESAEAVDRENFTKAKLENGKCRWDQGAVKAAGEPLGVEKNGADGGENKAEMVVG